MTSRLIKSSILAIMLAGGFTGAVAQNEYSKDGAMLYNLGAGYEWFSDAYSPQGFAIELRTRMYASERMFCEIMGHWGSHEGHKNVMQKGKPFAVSDERNSLFAAVGPGYDIFVSDGDRLNVYVKCLLGYGTRTARYDDYRPVGANDGTVTLGCEKNKTGIAAVFGTGVDIHFRQFTVTPAIDVIYTGKRTNIAATLSLGLFY